jgi:hypothetical protein
VAHLVPHREPLRLAHTIQQTTPRSSSVISVGKPSSATG